MGKHVIVALYGVLMIAVVVGLDLLFFRNRFWERLIVNPNVALKLSCAGKRFHVVHQIFSRCIVAAQSQAKPTVRARQPSSALDDLLTN